MNNIDTITFNLELAQSYIKVLKASGHLAVLIARQACDENETEDAKLNMLEENFNIDYPFMSQDETRKNYTVDVLDRNRLIDEVITKHIKKD